jgi:uncharacterized protein
MTRLGPLRPAGFTVSLLLCPFNDPWISGRKTLPLPVVFASPATVDLSPNPMPTHWVIEGTPVVRTARLATSADQTSSVMVWSCTAGRFEWRYLVDETLYILSGEVFVTDETGEVRRLESGDMAFFPAGSRSVWHVPCEVKKIAVCRQTMPRACGYGLRLWNKLIDVCTGFSKQPALAEDVDAARMSSGRLTTA